MQVFEARATSGAIPTAYEEIVVGQSAIGINPLISPAVVHAFVSIEIGPVRMRLDGGIPTKTIGHLATTGDRFWLDKGAAKNLQMISSSMFVIGNVRITYYTRS